MPVLKLGDKVILPSERDGRKIKYPFVVEKIYRHFVLCRHAEHGYAETFDWITLAKCGFYKKGDED